MFVKFHRLQPNFERHIVSNWNRNLMKKAEIELWSQYTRLCKFLSWLLCRQTRPAYILFTVFKLLFIHTYHSRFCGVVCKLYIRCNHRLRESVIYQSLTEPGSYHWSPDTNRIIYSRWGSEDTLSILRDTPIISLLMPSLWITHKENATTHHAGPVRALGPLPLGIFFFLPLSH
jgi:hypothetical protein